MLTVLRRLFRRIDAVVLCCALGLSAFSVVLLLGIQQMGVIGRRTVLMQVVAAGPWCWPTSITSSWAAGGNSMSPSRSF